MTTQFKKGTSGNPQGRPRKSTATADKLRSAIADDLPKIIDQLREAALSGNVQAAKLLLDRVLPPLKSAQQAVTVPGGDSLSGTGASIVRSMAAGQITAESAKAMLDSLLVQARLIEHEDFDERLKALEQKRE